MSTDAGCSRRRSTAEDAMIPPRQWCQIGGIETPAIQPRPVETLGDEFQDSVTSSFKTIRHMPPGSGRKLYDLQHVNGGSVRSGLVVQPLRSCCSTSRPTHPAFDVSSRIVSYVQPHAIGRELAIQLSSLLNRSTKLFRSRQVRGRYKSTRILQTDTKEELFQFPESAGVPSSP